MNPRRSAAIGAVRLVCAACLLLAAGAWGAPSAWAQQDNIQQRLQNLDNRLTNLLGVVLELQSAAGDDTDAVLRLARVEDLLRENAGTMEELSYRLQQLQQNAEAYQKDSVLRFQELEERFTALEARAAAGAEAAAATGLRFQELDDRLAALEAGFETEAAAAAEVGLRLRNLEERIAGLEARRTGDAVSAAGIPELPAAPEPLEVLEPENEGRAGLGDSLSVGRADGILILEDEMGLPDVVLAGVAAETNVPAEATTEVEETPDAGDVSVLDIEDDVVFPDGNPYENPFPDFSLETQPETSSDSSIERPVDVIPAVSEENDAGNAGDVADAGEGDDSDSEMSPKSLQAVAVEEQDAEAVASAEAESLYQSSYVLVERVDFAEDAGLQEEAINGFQNLAESWPQHELAADALYWIGEILYIREEYEAAAKAFLDVVKTYPSSPRAVGSMLKLGVTMRLLEKPENACAVFDELLFTDRYGKPSQSERRRIDLERRLAGC